jgi:hypothetical protein
MEFLKSFLINLALLIGLGIVLFLAAPDMMSQVFSSLWAILGPIALLFVVIKALPKKRNSRR